MTQLRHTTRVLAAILLAGLAASCGPQNNNRSEKLAHERGGRHGIRAACADDIQKFCANADKKKRCLRENNDKLSDTCKTALAQHRRRNGDKDNDTNNNANTNKNTNSDDDDN